MGLTEKQRKELESDPEKYARKYSTDELLDELNGCNENDKRKQVIFEILAIQQGKNLNIHEISFEELKKDPEKYAREYSTDELLDELNGCNENDKRKQIIIEILAIQQEIINKGVTNKESDDESILSTILDKFHTDIDSYSLKNSLIENGAKNPEFIFKLHLLKYITLIIEGEELTEDEYDILDEFINITDINQLNKLKGELEIDLKIIYSTKLDGYYRISSDDPIKDWLDKYRNRTNKFSQLRYENGRLDGKKIIPGHCAFDDSPEKLKTSGEDVVLYDLGDEYIPISNSVHSLELLNKIKSASVEELEKMCLENDYDFEFYKDIYKDNKELYILTLKQYLLEIMDDINILDMYRSGDHFMVVKATYKDKQIFDRKYINCWYVDIYSEKTKKYIEYSQPKS